VNYLTIAGYPETDAGIWPPDVQVMGKDILPRFHATIWPAVLLALGEPLPRVLFGHGWWVSDHGDKMSKSRGNIVDPLETAAELASLSGCSQAVAVDTVRYFLLREVHFGLDGSFSLRALLGRFNADLANDLGNLLNRTLPLIDRYLESTLSVAGSGALAGVIEAQVALAAAALEALDFRGYLEAVWELLAAGNKLIDEQQPWTLYKQGSTEACGAVLYDAADLVRVVATLVWPVMPEVSAEIWRQLGLSGRTDLLALEYCRAGLFPTGTRTEKGAPIFPRVDLAALDAEASKQAAPVAAKEKEPVETIKYEQFAQLDLRAGKVLDVAPVPESDKLFQLTVDLGEEEPRTVVAGLAGAFGARELLDAYVVVVANLEPAKIRGVVSNGMVLAVGDKEPLALVTVDRDVPPGAKVR
jgi:methionyl-tRNA synthetase